MPYEGICDEKFDEKCEQKIQEMKSLEVKEKYIIVRVQGYSFEACIQELIDEVNKKMKEGYVCIGDHVVTKIKEYKFVFSQAMELKNQNN